jgi:hypothetical protein
MTNGKMYKVMVPIERNGNTHWLRGGSAFTNKDESLNVYLDALPMAVFTSGQLKLQIREYSDEELRQRDEYRARRPESPPQRDHVQGTVPF